MICFTSENVGKGPARLRSRVALAPKIPLHAAGIVSAVWRRAFDPEHPSFLYDVAVVMEHFPSSSAKATGSTFSYANRVGRRPAQPYAALALTRLPATVGTAAFNFAGRR
jgi:hypothetical protein